MRVLYEPVYSTFIPDNRDEDRAFKQALTFFDPKSQWNPKYQRGYWDGNIRFWKDDKFCTGLISYAEEKLGHKFVVEDLPIPLPHKLTPNILKNLSFTGKYSYQYDIALKALEDMRGILWLATNAGKCLAPKTPIIMYNGEIKHACDIQVGDLLMGPDSTSREVLSTTSGTGQMYQITPKRGGASFGCNDAHILVLYDYYSDSVVEVSISEFLNWNKDRRRLAQLIRTPIDFPSHNIPCPIDPWFLGLWYAEGTKLADSKGLKVVHIANNDENIISRLEKLSLQYGVTMKNTETRAGACPRLSFITSRGKRNPLLHTLREIYGDGTHLPYRYMTGSREERAAFLAGFIDGDGFYGRGHTTIMQKRKEWVEDIAFIANSLGLRSHISSRQIKLKSWGEPREYWKVSMVGDFSDIPMVLERKKSYSKKQVFRVGFRIEDTGVGEYSGFTLSGDGRFLLGDFTITHNTMISAGMIKALEIPTLFLVESVDLMRQTYDVFKAETDLDIGMLGGGFDDVRFVTVAVTKSALLRSKEKNHPFKSFIRDVQMVYGDECHSSGNYTYSTVLQKCVNANYRYGLSGTPLDRGLIDAMRLIAYTGPVIGRVSNTELIDIGVSAKPTVYMHKADTTGCPNLFYANYPEAYSQLVVYNDSRNKQIIDIAKKGLEDNKIVLILVKQIAHGRVLQMMLEGEGIQVDFCFGGSGKEERYININKLRKKISKVLIMSKIGEIGIDIPSIDVLIRASGGKSTVSTLQSIGRGLRAKKGKDNVIDYHDFVDSGNSYLNAHSKARICDYEREEFEIIYDNSRKD